MLRRVGKGTLRAVPTISHDRYREWWARFRLRSSSYGGQAALPTHKPGDYFSTVNVNPA